MMNCRHGSKPIWAIYNMIPYGRQDISQSDIDAVTAVLNSDYLTQGPAVPKFEKVVSEYVSAKYAVATNSATSALHIACLALGLGPGDFLWTSPISFVASANCGLYCGAKVDFVDVDSSTALMSVEKLEEKLIKAKQDENLPKVVIPVHFAGQPCDMRKIYQLGQEYGFSVVEDASHAIGAQYKDNKVGGCRFSDITVFSFHPVKIITTGEGGMALTNQIGLAEKMYQLRSHGITRDRPQMVGSTDGAWYYQQTMLGFNYRMTDIQAALGISQLQKLNEYVTRRTDIAMRYEEELYGHSLQPLLKLDDRSSAWHLYVIRLIEERNQGIDRRDLFEQLWKNGIGVNVHYIPIHTQPYYQRMGFSYGDFPESESFYHSALTIPLYPTMKEQEQDRVIDILKQLIEKTRGWILVDSQ